MASTPIKSPHRVPTASSPKSAFRESIVNGKSLKCGIYGQLDAAGLKELDAIQLISTYPSDAVLFSEKEPARGVFILSEGQIKLSIASSVGKTLILQIARPGEPLGFAAVLGGYPYEATATALQPSTVAFIRSRDFLSFLETYPSVRRYILKCVVSAYGSLCDQLRTVALSSMPKRVARVLLGWSAGASPRDSFSSQITMPLTHGEIGELIGSARESVTRTLADFKDRHLITMSGAAVTIHDRKALEQIADD